jgi:deoxyribonuclease-4
MAISKPAVRRIGIHTSASGTLERAAWKAVELGANCFQIFSSSPRTWRAVAPDATTVERMQQIRKAYDLSPLVIHANYLINLCSAHDSHRPNSIRSFRGEIERALMIGAEYLVVHPGSCKDHPNPEAAMAAFADGLAESAHGLNGALNILLENTAGHGNLLGARLSDLRTLRDLVQHRVALRVGYCLDTCHSLAAGYPIHTAQGLRAFLREAEEVLGMENIPVIHANDSKGALGSHLDRHANIGEGYIGMEGFRRILNARPLREKAFILETPVDQEGDDQRNMDALRSLVA